MRVRVRSSESDISRDDVRAPRRVREAVWLQSAGNHDESTRYFESSWVISSALSPPRSSLGTGTRDDINKRNEGDAEEVSQR